MSLADQAAELFGISYQEADALVHAGAVSACHGCGEPTFAEDLVESLCEVCRIEEND